MRAAEVGVKSQRSAEMARGRAGSPTRAARLSPLLQRFPIPDPALPYRRGVRRGIGCDSYRTIPFESVNRLFFLP